VVGHGRGAVAGAGWRGPVLKFPSAAAFEEWLAGHHASADEVWIEFAKKGAGVPSVTYAEAVGAALCFGWIDGKVQRSEEEGFYRQRFTPRRARSKWSQINVAKAEALIAAGRMRPAGLAEVERAHADGRWEAAYASPSKIGVPEDLRRALDASPAAASAFESLSKTQRYSILYRVHEAKRPQTRARHIERFVEMLARGETPH
jgi:uncharacterized protein YdeI (YjbR/CyaY-like superfamily)